jgi:curli biogenesis system outer membrane secretion channel CsgG
MRKINYLLLSLFFILACAPQTSVRKQDTLSSRRNYEIGAPVGPKIKIAVARFSNNTRFGKRRLGENLADVLITELNKTGRFVVLERAEVDKIIEQYKLSLSGLTEGKLQNLELLDADYLVIGAVSHYSVNTTGSSGIFGQSKKQTARTAVDIRLVDVRDGRLILSETGEGIAEKEFKKVLGVGSAGGYDESLEQDAFRVAVIDLVEKIIHTLDQRPWKCDIVKIEGNTAYINAGKESNLKLGTVLQIYLRGEAVTDLNGKILGYKKQKLGTGKVIEYFGENGAILQLDQKIPFQKGLYAMLK